MNARTALLCLAALAASWTNAFAQAAVNVTDAGNPLVQALEAHYVKLLEAGRRGDVKAYLAMRTAEFAKKMESVTPEQLKQSVARDFDPKAFQFVRADSTGAAARTVYRRAAADRNQFEAVMFRNEGGQWKIGQTLSAAGPGGEAHVAPGLEFVLKQPHLQLR
jgi:hypothetical protein